MNGAPQLLFGSLAFLLAARLTAGGISGAPLNSITHIAKYKGQGEKLIEPSDYHLVSVLVREFDIKLSKITLIFRQLKRNMR